MACWGSNSYEIGRNDKLYSAPYSNYLSSSKQLEIENYYVESKAKNAHCNCKTMSIWSREPALCIKQHLFNRFGSDALSIVGYGDYTHYSNGYAFFTGINVKRSRYIMARELGFECFLPQYIVHHSDLNKLNDDIKNLFIAYDTALHVKMHKTFYKSFDDVSRITFENIKEFAEHCITVRLDKINQKIILPKSAKHKLEKKRQSIFRYLDLLDKLSIARNNSPVFGSPEGTFNLLNDLD